MIEIAVYKDDKTGKWYFRVYVTDPITGVRLQRERKGFELKRDALEAEADFVSDFQALKVSVTDFYITDLIDEYLIFLKKDVKATTYVGYEYQFDKHIRPFFLNVKLVNVTRRLIDQWYTYLEKQSYGYVYKNRLLNHVIKMFEFIENQYEYNLRYIKTFPTFKKTNKDKNTDVVIYTEDMFELFAKQSENILEKSIFYTMYYTGLRIGELRSITWLDINFDKKQININKQVTSKIPGQHNAITTTKSESSNRTVVIPELLINILNDWKNDRMKLKKFDDSWQVFGDHTFISENRIRRMVNRASDAAKLPRIKLHEFRHSYTTLLHSYGVDPLVIKAQAGHSSVQISLDVYTHLDTKKQQNVIDEIFDKNKN